ncbi:MAG: hypothetical protein JNG83_03585 [Opitutaceae bacterium]|nr:hypothetical protein [Opitutaceae bacterium]
MTTPFTELQERPPALEKDPPARSIGIGLACTFLFHILLVWLSPQFKFDEFSGVHSGISVQNRDRGKSFDFELTPGEVQPQERNPFRFVETNPDAPENTPDQTDNFSNRNQQSAQLEPAKELDPEHRPSVKGQDEIKNDTAIVSGELAQPQAGGAPAPEVTANDQQEQQEQKARMEQVPLSGFDKTEGQAEDGIATNISNAKRPSTQAQAAVEGAQEATDLNGGLVAAPPAARAQPKQRPRLTAPRPTILSNRVTGVSNIGILGMDARWSEYGEYLNELIEIVQVQWNLILRESAVYPARGSHVIVKFKINSKGETTIVTVEETSGQQGSFSCLNAIQARQPYRKWSDQMIAVLGNEQELTFGFYY